MGQWSMPGATPIGVLALIFTVLAFAQRLGGWVHKPTARGLLVVAGGLLIWWLTLVFPIWGAGICCGAALIVFSLWSRGKPIFGRHPHKLWIGAIVPGLLLLLGSISWAVVINTTSPPRPLPPIARIDAAPIPAAPKTKTSAPPKA